MTTQMITRMGFAAGLLLLGCLGEAGAAGSCPGGRFLVHGDALIAEANAPAVDAVVMTGSLVSVASGCRPVAAKLKSARTGTLVRAAFPECREAGRRFVLKATVDRTCTSMTGTFSAKRPKFRRRFVATLSTCGDGVLDAEAGEQCDDGTSVSRDGCEANCTRSAPPTTTTTTTVARTTTTTTTTLPPNIIIDPPPPGDIIEPPPPGDLPPGDDLPPPPLPF